jgi:hypothetical protein
MIVSYSDLPEMFAALVPTYKTRSYRPLVATVERWHTGYGAKIVKINPDRAEKRWKSYIIPEETMRVGAKLKAKGAASIRFGREKAGNGYHGERGDFCLVGGFVERRNLTLFYRSLELIGGLGYDVTLIDGLGLSLGIKWKRVTFMCARANVFALKRNSNEKLYPRLVHIFTGVHI